MTALGCILILVVGLSAIYWWTGNEPTRVDPADAARAAAIARHPANSFPADVEAAIDYMLELNSYSPVSEAERILSEARG